MAFRRPTVRSRSAPPINLFIRGFSGLQPQGGAVVSTGRRSGSTRTEFDPVQLHQSIFLFGAFPVYSPKGERSDRQADGRNRLVPSSIPFSSTIQSSNFLCLTLFMSSRVNQLVLLMWVILPISRKDLLNITTVKVCQREVKDLGGLFIKKNIRRDPRLL